MAQRTEDRHHTSLQKRQEREILEKLAELGGGAFHDDFVVFQGEKLIIPAAMTIPETIEFLQRKWKEEEKQTEFSRVFRYRPHDGAYCTFNAFKRTFGAVGHRGTMGFWGPNPPEMISLNTDVNKTEQIPWGRFDIPFLPNCLFEVGSHQDAEYGQLFKLTAMGPKKYRTHIEGVFKLVEDELKERSMYKGKAIDGQEKPEFVDLSGVDPRKVVYTDETLRQLEANVWTPLRYSERLRSIGQSLKRAVLVHGEYGTGKTLAAVLTAQVATSQGWTYIGARPGKDDLNEVMQTARLYAPAVVFYEDIDKVADPSEITGDEITRLLDRFDGIQAKGTEIICVMTTNFPDRIHKGMIRPGRLDAVVEIQPPDAAAVEKLIKLHVPEGNLADDIDWGLVGDSMKGYTPAFITEASGRAIKFILARNEGKLEGTRMDTEDLVNSALDLRAHEKLMFDASDDLQKDPLSIVLKREVGDVVTEKVDDIVVDRLTEAGFHVNSK